jgi:hypothetical protein
MTVPTACGERVALPAALVDAALRLAAPRAAGPEDVERELRCALERHDLGDHHAFVLELPGPTSGAVWARWTRGRPPVGVVVLPDCPVASPPPPSEPCCEFADHQGAHSWQLRAEDKQT